MKHAGKARKAGFRLILISLVLVAVVLAFGLFAALFGGFIMASAPILFAIWVVFALFTLYFFRDPNARVPKVPGWFCLRVMARSMPSTSVPSQDSWGAIAGVFPSFFLWSMSTSRTHP